MLCNRVLAGPEPSDARNLTHVRALRLSVLSALGIKEKDDVLYCLTRYALTLPVATVVSGIDSREVLHQNLNIVSRFVPMTVEERDGRTEKSGRGLCDRWTVEYFKTAKPW